MAINGDGDRKLAELATRLAGADNQLRNQLRRRWRAAAGPAADEVKNAILTGKADKYPNAGLRAEIAATVHVEVQLAGKVQVSIVSRGSEMPPGKTELPAHADVGGWRHPLFGDREHWYPQVSPRPGWFTITCLDQHPAFAGAAQRVLDDVGRQIQG